MAGIYIHIPFCKKACHYCNFHFSTSTGSIDAFTNALLREVMVQKNYLNEPIETIYFGGGTPSLLPAPHLQQVIDLIRTNYPVLPQVEITLEANPDDINGDKLKEWKRLGIERLSIGVQSFFDEDLRWMNRAHHAGQAEQSICLAQQAGFHNLTIDLIYGTPTLTDNAWKENLEKAFELDIKHLSCYALTVEPKTALDTMIQQRKVEPVDPDKQARHFEILVKQTASAGFEQYEISNFAKPGYRSKHNSSYWLGKPYLGLGPSAHSYNGDTRQWNVANNALYITSLQQDVVPFELEILSEQNKLNEYLMTSLRTIEGIDLERVLKVFGATYHKLLIDATKRHLSDKNVKLFNNRLQLTSKGKFFADGIAADLFQL